MSKKLTIIAFFIASLIVISWSAGVIAEEKAQKSKEAQIKQAQEQIKELEYALERERNDEKAAKLKKTLQERRKKLERLTGGTRRSAKSEEQFSEIQAGIRSAKGNMKELRNAVKALKEEGGNPENLKELQGKLAREERKLVELNALLEKRKAGAKQERQKPRSRLMFFPLEHANAQNLGKIIQEFLTPSGTVVGDSDSNILVIKATGNDLEIASVIIKNLDVPKRRAVRDQPRRRQESRDREERENVFFGEVLGVGKQSLTIKTRDSGEKVTLYVPLRKKEDGTRVPYEELSRHVASFDVGANVKVQWRQGEDRRFIQRVTDIKKEAQRREREARWEVFFGKVLKSGKESLTIKTRDSGEEVTLYVRLRKKEDGTLVPYEELSMHVSSFEVGTPVKVQWSQDEGKRWIQRVSKIEE